jgi:BrnA antitoxin of type II toxin-antitoxin system
MRDQATRSALSPPIPLKSRVSLRLDAEVLEWFRGQAREQGGGQYQTMINAALQQHIFAQGKTLEDRIRRIVREELHAQERRVRRADHVQAADRS